MALLSRTLTPAARARKPRRLTLEELEARFAPSAVVSVNAAANIHAIDPDIYGSAYATTAQLADLNLTINRDGGNSSDTYDWQVDDTNHASDWYYESIASGSGNGQGMDSFVSQTKAGGAQPDLTVDIMPYAAKLGAGGSDLGSYPVSVYGSQQYTDPYNANFGNGVTTSGQNILDTHPLYNYVANSPSFEQSWIQHLISTFGNSQNGGVQYYTLGNEPGLWNSTHRDIHPTGETNTELLNDYINYGSMIKSLDPNAQILGPEEWGWTNYFVDGADAAAGNYGATYTGIHGESLNVEQWLLQQLAQYQAQNGTRLLDYFTLHYYPQESVNGDYNGGVDSNNVDQATELLRNQVTRSLWDPTYVDPSWIASTGINGGKVDLIPMMQSWVNTYYPGTMTGITEYNFGAEGDMNGATTQADLYGIFGQQGLNLATRWTTPATGTPTYLAMKLWRNYDGNDSGFGNTSVGASVGNPDQTDAFAALRSSDGALTVAVINKNLYDPNNPSATTAVTVNLSGFAGNGVAQAWQLAAINPSNQTNAAITHLANVPISGNSFTLNMPMESVTMFVIEPATPPAFTSGTPPSSITAGQTYSFTFTVSGSPTPTLSASNLPSWLTLTPATGVLSGSPTLATTYTNLAVIASNAAGSATITFNLTVTPGALDHLGVTASPSSITANSGLGLIVTALDRFGNPTSDAGTVTFMSNDPLVHTPAAPVSFSGGTAFAVGTLETATGTGWTITATDATGHNGPSNLVLVTPAAASHFNVSAAAVTASAHLVAGTGGASESGSTVTINTTTAHGFTVGQSVNIAGVSVAGYNGTVMITSVPSPISFTFTARANHLLLPASGGGTVTSVATTGSAFNVLVTALDPYGNTATGYTGTVKLTSSDTAATFPVNNYTFTTTGGSPDNGMHTFSATLNTPGTSQTLTATDNSNASIVGSTSGGISTVGLYLTAFATTPSGFTATFNKLLNPSQLDYYRFSGETVAPDISMTVGSSTTTVNGSVVVTATATQTTLTFVSTAGALTAGQAYTVTLDSGSNGILDTAGGQLAGDVNGVVPGTSYSVVVIPVAAPAPTLSIPGFARGPGNTVLLPAATGTGIPVTLKNAPANTTSVTFTLDFTPALLDITGPTSGSLVLTNPATANSTGVANFTFSTTTAISTSSAVLGQILANVPSSAANQYKAKALLDLPVSLITIGGNSSTTASPFLNADGVDINAYLADTNADFLIDGPDAAADLAVIAAPLNAANQPAGLLAYPLADPALVGSPSAAAKPSSNDVTLINRYVANLSTPQIPTPPTNLTYTSAGPDPSLSVPAGLPVSVGGTVTVPVNLDDARPAGSTGLTEATLALTYDPQVLTVSASDVQLGTVPSAGSGWTLTTVVNAVTGQLAITLESATPITQAIGGSLVTIDFQVQPGAVPGATLVAVVETVDPSGQRLFQTNVFDGQGAFTLSPAPTNSAGDPVTGLVELTAPVPTTAVVSGAGAALTAGASTAAVDRTVLTEDAETLAEAVPAATTGPAAPVAVAEENEEAPVADAPTARAIQSAAHPAGGAGTDIVAVLANGVAAQQAASLVFQFGNASFVSVPVTGAQHLADQWFLGRGTGDPADWALPVGSLDETSGRVLPGLRASAQTTEDNLDNLIWDSAGTALDWLSMAGGRRSTSTARPPEATAMALMTERAALDQYFAGLSDEPDQAAQQPSDE